MNLLEDLLNDYAAADEAGRLCLFLAHREFRERFMQIELQESSIAVKRRVDRPARRWLERLHSSLEAIYG